MLEPVSKAKIKWLRSLQLKKNREQESVFVVEGEKMVLEGLESCPELLVTLIVQKDFTLPAGTDTTHAFTATTAELEQISAFKSPNKLIAVFKRPEEKAAQKGFTIALDSVQDPGNMGTILRLADWFGVPAIVCSEQTVDCYNPKVIQASMGAIFRIRVVYTNLGNYLQEQTAPVYAALLEGTDYTKTDYRKEGILLMGNEGQGISPALFPFISEAVTIPRKGAAESLNVATATAILLAEINR